ncbi:MAG TPA: DUF1592 domain-containing protein [Pirellulales bacterium]|nr:DUF1592 domain-containing protein [Pirellulales bacterium]
MSFNIQIRQSCVIGLPLVVLMLAVGLLPRQPAAAGEPDLTSLGVAYPTEIQPLVARYCHKCHSGERIEAEIDLASFATWADVRKHPPTWQKVGEMLDGGQMPPKEAPQPTDAERTRLEQWVRSYLTAEAQARAGDPGRVVLRRLGNAEYTYTLRDLTGVDSLEPAREFPVDGAAGEGFTNTGNALVMSPSLLTKYLDAAKEIAGHAVLLPDGFRFSTHTTRRDWTDDTVSRIRDFYREFTDPVGGTQVNLQGIISETNQGGRLPLEKYLTATLAERQALTSGGETIGSVARKHGLNAKYLGTLWTSLTSSEPSLLLDGLRSRWQAAKPDGAAALAADVAAWQKELWRFGTVGHIGKVGGPKAWLEPVNPLTAKQELRFKVPAAADAREVTLSLVASDAGDGDEHDFAVWQRPRLVAAGRPDLLLRDVREVCRELTRRRGRMFADTAKYLGAAAEAAAAAGTADAAELARKHGVEIDALAAWFDYLGIGTGGAVELKGQFTNKIVGASGYDFISGWGANETPLLVANSSDQHVRIPGNMKPHGVAVHPSPTLRAAVGWRSPVTAAFRVEAAVTHAHPECGNGVTWSLELRRGATRRRLAAGIAQGSTGVVVGPIDNLPVQTGDIVSLLIGPRDGNHACDLTAIELKLTSGGDGGRTWNLAEDVSSDILAGNPHVDRAGNQGVWHFYTEPDQGGEASPVVPAESLLAKWQTAEDAVEKNNLADAVRKLLTSGPPEPNDSADAVLYRQLTSLGGPLFSGMLKGVLANAGGQKAAPATTEEPRGEATAGEWGADPSLFGRHPQGGTIDAASLCVHAPSVVAMRLPADLVAGCELVATGVLDQEAGLEGSVQLQVVAGKPAREAGLLPVETTVSLAGGQWTADNRRIAYGTPILVNDRGAARRRIESAFDEFRRLFPAALCYAKIVPVDEVVTLTLFYREDDHLARLMLDPRQKAALDRLWDDLHYISQDALTLVDAYAQLMEFATQDADPKVFEPLRRPINDRAAAFRQVLIDSEPKHLDALLEFAARAYRRPLESGEKRELLALYGRLREQEMGHDEAFRLTLARVLVAPAFLYRLEKPGPGAEQVPLSDWELASRLSYFLWSSQPDHELRELAAAGQLRDPNKLVEQMRRMLLDGRTRRLATEFACQWLHIRDFDHLDEKSERHFPTFTVLRGAMYEESIQFFTDLFQNDGSVLDILDADHTFLNEELAKHYGIPGVSGAEWRRVAGVKRFSRGGILGLATTLATQSGASRTSPILRGNWISEVLLGERLPRPPKDVPRLPDDEAATEGLTVRQLVERHTSDPKCAVCHQRIDALGFALEGFDAIGRRREKDLGDRPIDTRVTTMDQAQFDGLAGLRDYLLTVRREAFLRQFCRKLLGYALGRGVQLSDEPLLAEMLTRLQADDDHIVAAFETIVRSRQFREIRGRETAYDDYTARGRE